MLIVVLLIEICHIMPNMKALMISYIRLGVDEIIIATKHAKMLGK